MAVTSVKWNDRGHSGSATGSGTSGVQRKYSASLIVECSSRSDTPKVVLDYLQNNADWPTNGRPYKVGDSRDTGVYCKTLEPQRVEGSDTQYLVGVQWESNSTELQVQKQDGQGRPTTNPFLWRDELSTSDYTVTVPAESGTFRGAIDRGGFPVDGNKLPFNGFTPVMNSALEIFDPPPEREVSIDVVRITKIVGQLFPHLYMRFKGSVNNDNVVINKGGHNFLYRFGPYQGKIKSINNVFDIANGIPHFKQTVELHINPLGWRRFIPDRGTNEIFVAEEVMDGISISNSDVGGNGYFRRRALDPRGNPVDGLLNGNGKLLKKGQEPVYLIYQIDNELPFAGIQW